MIQQTTEMAHFATFSDWNRFPLPASFRGCVDHTPSLLAEEDRTHWLRAVDQLVQSPFTDLVLGPLRTNEANLDTLLAELRERAPHLMPWLDTPSQMDLSLLTRLAERHPQCGIQLRVQLGGCTCEKIGQQLEALIEITECLQRNGQSLCLVLQDAPGASPQQLRVCVEFAQHLGIARITLCDQQARLTPLGVRNLLNHLREQFPDLPENGPALAFKSNDRHGFALANSMSAIANGIQFVHGAMLCGPAQGNPLALNQLLSNYAIPAAQQAGRYAEAIGQLTGLPIDNEISAVDCPPETHTTQTSTEVRAYSSPLAAATPRFIFKVSADDWHVQLLIDLGDQQLDLGERVHHYVLLLLAREFCQQQQARQQLNSEAVTDPISLGWVEREHLHKMIGDSQAQLNVKLFRAIKQINCALSDAGLKSYKPVLTRVGSIRFACPDFTIFKDSTLEHDVRGWMRLDASAQPQAGKPISPSPHP